MRLVLGLMIAALAGPARAEVIWLSGPETLGTETLGTGAVVSQEVILRGWKGTSGTVDVLSHVAPVSLRVAVECGSGQVAWRADHDISAGKGGGVITEVPLGEAGLVATFADGDRSFFPPVEGNPVLNLSAQHHATDGYAAKDPGVALNALATSHFFSRHAALGHALTLELVARACRPGQDVLAGEMEGRKAGLEASVTKWQPRPGGAAGAVTIGDLMDTTALRFEVLCDMGSVFWRPEVRGDEGAVRTQMDADGAMRARFRDGSEGFYPPQDGDPALSDVVGEVMDVAALDGLATEEMGVLDALSRHPELIHGLTGALMARACTG